MDAFVKGRRLSNNYTVDESKFTTLWLDLLKVTTSCKQPHKLDISIGPLQGFD